MAKAISMRRVRMVVTGFLFVLIASVLTGCRFPTELFFSPNQPPPNEIVVIQPPPTVTPGDPTVTAVTNTPTPISCAYVWAEQSLPDVSAMLQDDLNSAGLSGVEVVAVAYGENCVEAFTNQVFSFVAMETDFYFTAAVADAENHEALGNLALRLLTIIDEYPPGKVPGPNKGNLVLLFQDGSKNVQVRLRLDEAQRLRDAGLRGRAFFEGISASQ